MFIRGLWILNEKDDGNCEILFARRYTTVESRVRNLSGLNYVNVPTDMEIAKQFRAEVVEGAKKEEIHTYVGTLKNGSVWPVVFLKRIGLYFATVVVVEDYYKTSVKPPLSLVPGVTGAFSMLEDVSQLITPLILKNGRIHTAEATALLGAAIPFGQPVDTKPDNVRAMVRQGFPTVEVLSQKRPAWKPYLFKGKQHIEFKLQEVIDCVMYDSPTKTDTCDVMGRVICKAEMEGLPEITVFLLCPTEVSHMSVDPSVQTIADVVATTSKLSFTPPLDPFPLCSYGLRSLKKVPLRGFYQMKEISANVVKMLVQLKLETDINNHFEYCQLFIPFKNRGPIANVQMSPTAGSVSVIPNLCGLLWNIGQKFTGRNLEVALPAEVFFHPPNTSGVPPTNLPQGPMGAQLPYPVASISPLDRWAADVGDANDPFLVGPNSYAKLYFKISNCTISGMNVDSKRLSIFPNSKAKVSIERELISGEYVIWNSLGDARYSVKPPE